MKQILNALFLTIISLVTFSCSDVPSPYDINGGDGPAGIEGAGTYENPYTVADAIKTQNGNAAWVKGYIVGIMGNKYKPNGEFDGNEAVFTPPFTINTNVLIAATPDETNIKKCLPVKVKGGSELSVALNLKDHPENLGQPLIISGKLAAGFGMPAMIETTGAFFDGKLIGEGGGTDPDPEPPTGTVLFEETFAASQGLFTIENVLLPEGSTFVWQWSAYEGSGYMKASAFINDQNKAADSRLISPSIDLTKSTNATLVFDHAWKFAADKTAAFTLWVTEAGTNAWTQVAIPNYSDGVTWTFVSSGNISLNNYVGKNIQIAFKYVSTTESAGMWEVKNVKVVGDGEDVPEPPIDGTKIFTETFGPTVAATTPIVSYTAWDNSDLTFSGIASDLRAIAHKTEANKTETTKVNNIWFPANKDSEFSISGIKAAGYSKFVLIYEEAANIYDAGSTIDLNVLKVAFNGTELTVPSKVVVAAGKGTDANIFYEMKVEINVAGTDNSTLKFSAATAQNNMGLRLYNIRLVGVEEGGGTDPDPEPSTDNLLANPSFEAWDAANPDSWGRETVTSGTNIKITSGAQNGANAVQMNGTSSNTRFGSNDIALAAGSYIISVYAKNAVSGKNAKLKMGYVPIVDGAPNTSSYTYVGSTTAISVTDDWTKYEIPFEVKTTITASVFLVNAKSGADFNLLIDNVSLTVAQ